MSYLSIQWKLHFIGAYKYLIGSELGRLARPTMSSLEQERAGVSPPPDQKENPPRERWNTADHYAFLYFFFLNQDF